MAVGDKIAATDYNTIQGKIALVLGPGSGDYGYGQTVLSTSVSTSSRISMTQWANLRTDLLRARQHQIGGNLSSLLTDPAINLTVTATDAATNRLTVGTNTTTLAVGLAVTFSGTTFGGIVAGTTYYISEVATNTQFTISANLGGAVFALTNATGSMTMRFGGIKITDSDRAAYNTLADTITTNRLTVPPVEEISISSLVAQQQRAPGWNGTIQQTITIDFADSNAARHFFNAGTLIQFSGSLTGGDTTPNGKDDTWRVILSSMGTISFGFSSTTATSGTGSSYGWSTITSSQVQIYEKDVTGSTYYPNKYVILASKPSASQLQFVIQWRDDNSPGGWHIDEAIGGTVTSYVQLRRPSTSNVTIPVPTANTSSIG
jgi:hypothetical protein